jgi:hypothetical protein
MSPPGAAELTRLWLQDWVLAMDLCPFAAPVVRDSTLRIAVSDARDADAQLQAFLLELDLLQSAPETDISTTLLVYSWGPEQFADYLLLLDAAQSVLQGAELTGIVQLASFHPAYQFAGEAPDAVSNFTNRSPFPTLHLLREAMMDRVLAGYPDPAAIPRRNIEMLESRGAAVVSGEWQRLFGQATAEP